MASPTPDVNQASNGRYGEATFSVNWFAEEPDNLENEKLLDTDNLSGQYDNARFAIEKIEWAASDTLTADVEFNSMPPGPDGLVLSIPQGATAGEIDFKKITLNGCKTDPNRDSPGDVVVNTLTAAANDKLFIHVLYKEKGTTPAP